MFSYGSAPKRALVNPHLYIYIYIIITIITCFIIIIALAAETTVAGFEVGVRNQEKEDPSLIIITGYSRGPSPPANEEKTMDAKKSL